MAAESPPTTSEPERLRVVVRLRPAVSPSEGSRSQPTIGQC